MSLKQFMQVISQISQGAAAQDAELHKKYGLALGLSFDDPATAAYLQEAQRTAIPLEGYLRGLALSDVKKLVTLMYAGRDVSRFQGAGSLGAFHNELKQVGVHDKDKDAYIQMISEKILSLSQYFSSATAQLQDMGIDPDADLAHIA